MTKYECSHTLRSGVAYFVIVKANSEEHAREMATACTRSEPYFREIVDTGRWNVSPLDHGHSGDPKILDYFKR